MIITKQNRRLVRLKIRDREEGSDGGVEQRSDGRDGVVYICLPLHLCGTTKTRFIVSSGRMREPH